MKDYSAPFSDVLMSSSLLLVVKGEKCLMEPLSPSTQGSMTNDISITIPADSYKTNGAVTSEADTKDSILAPDTIDHVSIQAVPATA